MAKVQIKSEKVTPFGGIFHVRELFSRYMAPIIDQVRFFHPVISTKHSFSILLVMSTKR